MKQLTTLLLLWLTLAISSTAGTLTAATATTGIATITAGTQAESLFTFDFDDDDDNEKKAIGLKDKRISDKFIDTNHVKELLIAFFINLIAIMIVVRGLYYPKCKRGEFFFTYILIAISTFMLIYVLGDVKLKAGIALGLFEYSASYVTAPSR